MAIVMAIQKWRPYLFGGNFVVRTDQRSLKYLLDQRTVTEDHQKWLSKLLGYKFDIEYRPGKDNGVADALSQKIPEAQLSIRTTSEVDWVELWRDVEKDDELQLIKQQVITGTSGLAGYTVEQGRLLFKGKIVLPRRSKWVSILFSEFHEGVVGGHSRMQKTYQRLAREVYWKGMKGDIAKLVAECDVCQRQKYSTMAPSGLLQPLELPTAVWSEVTMDFIDGLPRSDGYSVMFVVVDRLSKYAHFIPVKHTYTAPIIAPFLSRK